MDLGAFGQWGESRRFRVKARAGGTGLRSVRMRRRAVRAPREGARGVGGCARAGGGPRGTLGGQGREREWSVPPRQSPSGSLSRASACGEVDALCREEASRERPLLERLPENLPRRTWLPQPARDGENRCLPQVIAGPLVLRRFVQPVLGFLVQAEKNFEVGKRASVLVSVGSAPRPALQTAMKNQDKKNGAAKPSGGSSHPKSSPGHAEAGPEGAQGLPSPPAPATEAEGPASQAPGKPEGACRAVPAGRGRRVRWPASSWR